MTCWFNMSSADSDEHSHSALHMVSAVSHMFKIGQSILKKDAPNAPSYRFTFDEHSPSARPVFNSYFLFLNPTNICGA